MAKLAYLECPTGIAGDMCLGAIVHAGVPLAYLIKQLSLLGIVEEYRLQSELVYRNGQQATKVYVHLESTDFEVDQSAIEPGIDPHNTFAHHEHVSQKYAHYEHSSSPVRPHLPTSTEPKHEIPKHDIDDVSLPEIHADHQTHGSRHLPEIEHLIGTAGLPPRATAWSLAVFRRLAEAEGAVHGISPDQVHFHEVGATDAIVDIVGTCLGLDWLDIDRLYCSPLPTGGGTIRTAHGRLPVPTPAVLKLWEMRQVPIYSNGIQRELVTPTGAAIATTLAIQFGNPPTMTLQKVGLGAGSRDLPIPNLLRLWLGEGELEAIKTQTHPTNSQLPVNSQQPASPFSPQPAQESIALLETQIDDLSPQAIGYVYDALFEAGALDVFTQAIGMKKSRPGVLLSVVCHPAQVRACEAVLFQETTTLGIRQSCQQRTLLQRELQTVITPHGAVRVKVARWVAGGAIVNVQPEYEDCAAIARQTHQPWREVHRLALQQWYGQQSAIDQYGR
jgi:pyridinium-3,5-bisthiocarboxylic acid mononucleotide nickel chelatase